MVGANAVVAINNIRCVDFSTTLFIITIILGVFSAAVIWFLYQLFDRKLKNTHGRY